MNDKKQMYEKELEIAVQAVREASALCRSVQSSIAPDALEKKDRSPVTIADFGSQALVCRALSNAFPLDPIIAEEDSSALRNEDNREVFDKLINEMKRHCPGVEPEEICAWIDRGRADKYCERFWTLDPIDGTKGFLRGDQYAVALALIVEGELAVAALACPNLPAKGSANQGAVFSAIRGRGAYAELLEAGEDPEPIRVSDVTDTSEIRFCESVEAAHSSHSDSARIAERLGIVAAPVRIDSQAKYAVVARGEGDAYLRLPKSVDYQEKIWDHAGGALIVAEAGGIVTDIKGRPLDFTHGRTLKKNQGVIVSNGKVHDPILDAIQELVLFR
ncbi:MAG: 3'(2'),5'-bisphosphate nucleotidase [Proteobacteria bacterium]|nr:3'(2'),5'-bisphosphate nucleotidase [Pseudomonadota bacterium]